MTAEELRDLRRGFLAEVLTELHRLAPPAGVYGANYRQGWQDAVRTVTRIDPDAERQTGVSFRELLAAQVHESWMAAKRAQGVTSRDGEDGEDLMVPYEDLSEAQKDQDRTTVHTVLTALAELSR